MFRNDSAVVTLKANLNKDGGATNDHIVALDADYDTNFRAVAKILALVTSLVALMQLARICISMRASRLSASRPIPFRQLSPVC